MRTANRTPLKRCRQLWTHLLRRRAIAIGRTRAGRILLVAVAVALIVLGSLLLVRPLTALLVCAAGTVSAFIALALKTVIESHRRASRVALAIALLLAALAVLLLLPQLLHALPVLLSIALALNAVRLAVVATGGRAVLGRLTDAALAVCNLLCAFLAWSWPDLATLAVGALFSLGLLRIGILLLAAGMRPASEDQRRERGTRMLRARAVLQLVAALGALVLIATAAWGSYRLHSGAPGPSEFYRWSEALPAEPGVLLRVAPYDGQVPDGAEAMRMLYTTTYSDGSPAVASAVVAVPVRAGVPAEPATVLAWQHGTTGVAQSCAPSLGPDALTEYAVPGISDAVRRGWVVVAVDYPGQGTEGRYPYLVGEGEARATLDGIRAAAQIDGVRTSGEAWLWGHSQGGHATLWAGEAAGRYAPEIELLGVAALSAASDPLALAKRIMGSESSALADVVISFVLIPYVDEYAELDLGAMVHPAGQVLVEAFASRCATEASALVSLLSVTMLGWDAPLYDIELDSGPVHKRLVENITDGIVPAPLFMGQGEEDEVIPIEMQRALHEALCSAGRTVDAHEYPGRTHMGVVAEGSPLIGDLYAWADRVLAGERPSSCVR